MAEPNRIEEEDVYTWRDAGGGDAFPDIEPYRWRDASSPRTIGRAMGGMLDDSSPLPPELVSRR